MKDINRALDPCNSPRRDIHAEIRDDGLGILRDLGIPWPPQGKRTHIRCPFPDHPDNNPSWRYVAHKRRAYCTCAPSGLGIVDVVMRKRGVSFPEAAAWIRGEDHARAHAALHAPAAPDRDYEAWKAAREQQEAVYLEAQHKTARWLWGLSRDPQGLPVEAYLSSRGITGPPPPTIKCLPASPKHPHPAMIAAYAPEPWGHRGEITPLAVNLVKLAADGRGKAPIPKEEQRRTIGSPSGSPIAIAPVTDGELAILEGVESALSFHAATGIGAWASGPSNFMPALAANIPAFVKRVIIWREADKAGRAGADGLAARIAARSPAPEIVIVEAE
jgi:hypothetical protein